MTRLRCPGILSLPLRLVILYVASLVFICSNLGFHHVFKPADILSPWMHWQVTNTLNRKQLSTSPRGKPYCELTKNFPTYDFSMVGNKVCSRRCCLVGVLMWIARLSSALLQRWMLLCDTCCVKSTITRRYWVLYVSVLTSSWCLLVCTRVLWCCSWERDAGFTVH